MSEEFDSIDKLLYGDDTPLSSDVSIPLHSTSSNSITIVFKKDKPTEEGDYFVQYHRNFEPIYCYVSREDDGELWLNTKSTSKLLKEVNAYCYGSL